MGTGCCRVRSCSNAIQKVKKGTKMKNILGLVLLGVGGYVLYEWYTQSASGAKSTPIGSSTTPNNTTTTTNTTPTVNANNPVAGTIATSLSTTRELLQNWANNNGFYQAQNGLMTPFQWAYGYNAVRGNTSVDIPNLFLPDNTRLLTIDEFLSVIGTNGLSGISDLNSSMTGYERRLMGWM